MVDVLISEQGDMTVLTLNRPDKANAVTADMLAAVRDSVRAASGQKVIVLTGAGKVFSAGMDLEAAKTDLPTSPIWDEVSNAIAAHPGLTIAALNGTVAGGALGMVLACDLRVAAETAKLFYPVMRLGFLPQPADPGRLRALVGPARAKRILMAGEKITADDCLAWGLFDRLCPADQVMNQANEMAEAALGASHSHISGIKRLIG
ncbi:enoyl-CoA hydratase/isomerase family protein [Shimia ponticola]|uniref:enoyl-CoA hydratase/isomerase family protein n=1 Tax=Shimia ponticola TaxID=2582893 RepID=UPI0011BE043C|nr:enoyl-CoA hydratase/isomerase family protein [Shimia ponticola]